MLHIDEGVELAGSIDPSDYDCTYATADGNMTMTSAALINGAYCSHMATASGQCLEWRKLKNVTIQGNGTINGNSKDLLRTRHWAQCTAAADPFNPWSTPYCQDCTGNVQRPSLMLLMHIDGLTVRDVTLHSSAFWTLHPAFCSDVHIHDVAIFASLEWWQHTGGHGHPPAGNADGIDLTSCSNAVVENAFIRSGDDCIGFYALDGWSGREYGSPLENVVIRNVSCGTPMSLCWMAGGIRNVTVRVYHSVDVFLSSFRNHVYNFFLRCCWTG